MLLRVGVEHELRDGAMQPGHAALEQREARAGDLGGGGEIDETEPFADVDVIPRRKSENTRRPDAANLDVVGGGFS